MSSFEVEKNNVGPGWQELISDLHKNLTGLMPNYEVIQIKEKFGGLRYYTSSGNGNWPVNIDRAHRLIDAAEAASRTICEDCGSRDEVSTRGPSGRRHGWIRTLCAVCHTTNDARR